MFCNLIETRTTADSLDEAVGCALERLRCSRAEVEIDIVQAPSRLLFGLLKWRPAVVEARIVDRGFVASRMTEHLLGLCGFPCEVEVHQARDRIELQIKSEESSLIIGRHGQTLDALQSLVVASTDRLLDDRTEISLETDGYRARRAAFLTGLVRRLSSEVRKTGKPGTIHSFSPSERRIIQVALADEEGVAFRSAGKGSGRKVIISSSRGCT